MIKKMRQEYLCNTLNQHFKQIPILIRKVHIADQFVPLH